ncbi:hypothetical protein HK100_004665, partial [Physocladia obscura]
MENRYRWRKTERGGICWICRKESANVLVSGENFDWFYACESHLLDHTFCTELVTQLPQLATTSLSANLLPDQKQQQQQQQERNETNPNDLSEKKSASLFDMFDKKFNIIKPPSPPPPASSLQNHHVGPSPSPSISAGPRFFKLDDKIYFLRQNEKKQKEAKLNSSQAKQSAL